MSSRVNREEHTEADLWVRHIADLRKAVELRKPDALSRIKTEITRLDNEISAWSLRREVRAKAGMDTAELTTKIEFLADRMEDLRNVAKRLKSSMLDHDYGTTPEAANKPVEMSIEDLNDELKRAAMEIHAGYSVITRGMKGLAAQYGETFEPGPGNLGTIAERLRRQYFEWVQEMHRKRKSPWAVEDVVCQGFSRWQSAQRRNCSPTRVYDELVFGLDLYASAFPPTTSSERT